MNLINKHLKKITNTITLTDFEREVVKVILVNLLKEYDKVKE